MLPQAHNNPMQAWIYTIDLCINSSYNNCIHTSPWSSTCSKPALHIAWIHVAIQAAFKQVDSSYLVLKNGQAQLSALATLAKARTFFCGYTSELQLVYNVKKCCNILVGHSTLLRPKCHASDNNLYITKGLIHPFENIPLKKPLMIHICKQFVPGSYSAHAETHGRG